MSTNTINGHAHQAQNPRAAAEAQLDQIVKPIIGNTVNGLFVTVQGLQPDVLARAVARAIGEILGRVICQGPLPVVLSIRAQMKEDIAKAMDGVTPIMPPAAAPGANQFKG